MFEVKNRFVANSLEAFFNPKSVAVIGASEKEDSVGYAVLHNILQSGFKGSVYPVNVNKDFVQGLKAYKSINLIENDVDLAVIAIPATYVLTSVKEVIEKKVKAIVVITAGFKEIGDEGKKLENKIKKLIKENDVRLMGPNCLGVINTDEHVKLNATFGNAMPENGEIAFLSQSGALCTAVLDYATQEKLGFSKFVSYGNKSDVDEVDLLNYLKDDDATKIIIMYLEDVKRRDEFINVCNDIVWNKHKPILVLKAGRSKEAARAVSSHTGSLAGSDNLYKALFEQARIIRVDKVKDMFNVAKLFVNTNVPINNRFVILTNAGGPGIISTDAFVENGIKMAELSESSLNKLKYSLPAEASLKNPIDILGDATAERYKKSLEILLQDDQVDGVHILLTPQFMTKPLEIAKILPDVYKKHSKTILTSFMGNSIVNEAVEYLKHNNIYNFAYPEEAALSVSKMVKFKDLANKQDTTILKISVNEKECNTLINKHLGKERCVFLTQEKADELLKYYNVPVAPALVAVKKDDVVKIKNTIGYPCVMKIISKDIVHKVDAGCVKIGIKNENEALTAFDEIINNAKKFKEDIIIEGIYVQKMVGKGIEVIVGGGKDNALGPYLMFGLGGTYVELFKDVSFKLAPLRKFDAMEMIKSTKCYKLLKGFRDILPSDIDAIVDTIMKLSQMLCDISYISEIDINPLMVFSKGKGCIAVDSRILLRRD
ncbi:MAG: acetate--CoA ligase family protein [Deferribacterota bacterium]|nr:acetate--CoA ligase family protein [Deferribacterota bacterium]